MIEWIESSDLHRAKSNQKARTTTPQPKAMRHDNWCHWAGASSSRVSQPLSSKSLHALNPGVASPLEYTASDSRWMAPEAFKTQDLTVSDDREKKTSGLASHKWQRCVSLSSHA